MCCKMTFMRKILSILLVLFAGGLAFAQSANVVTEILDTEQVTYGQVCYLSAVRQGLISENDSYDAAVQVLFSNGQIPEDVDATAPVYLANLAFVYAQIWPDMKGGLLFKLTKGSPRYAFKQFKADGVIDEDMDPGSFVSGRDALSILTSCMLQYGTDEAMEMNIE